jgi:hypothetical protein
MKYLEQYIEEKIKIKILGELTTRECCEGDGLGVSLVIDGFEPGIEVWYADYSNWLEEQLEEKIEIIESKKENTNMINFTLEDFRNEVLSEMKDKPKAWRDGQFVFNYIDEKYNVARYVQFVDRVDCFYDDENINSFIVKCYEALKNNKNGDNFDMRSMIK